MNIRTATNQDQYEIEKVYLSAFSESEREIVSKLAIDLLFEKTVPETLSWVSDSDGEIVGHISFSPITLDGEALFQGYILAPLGVTPPHQKQRIGSQLIEQGLQQLSTMEINAVFVYGNPGYYGKFGFSADAAAPYTAPYTLQYPFGWQAIILNEYALKQPTTTVRCVAPLCNPTLW